MKSLIFLLLTLSCAGLQAQRTITGTVRNLAGDPIIGALILVPGNSGAGTHADLDGNYTLDLPDGTERLTFLFDSYSEITVPVGDSNVMDIYMSGYGYRFEESNASARPIIFSGRIVDTQGDPLPAVGIYVGPGRKLIHTDEDGVFSTTMNRNINSVLFLYPGSYSWQKLPNRNRKNLLITIDDQRERWVMRKTKRAR